jgi:hypothetical protein
MPIRMTDDPVDPNQMMGVVAVTGQIFPEVAAD